jgi:hypothetical protein
MKRSTALWILALLLTIASAVVQRVTGPTYPVSGSTTMRGERIDFSFDRSHGGETNAVIRIQTHDSSIHGEVVWKRYKTTDEWQRVAMKTDNGNLSAELPHQPPGGKLQYRVLLDDGVESISLPEKDAVVMRFKGEVPLAVLIPHIIAMFTAMLLSTRAGLECFAKSPTYKKLVSWTIGFLIVGGFILGPLVQVYAFNAVWTGWPFGVDLTDNKTTVALIAWIVSAVAIRRTAGRKKWVLGASIITMVVFLIPHSLFGTELDYNAEPQHQTVSGGFLQNGREKGIFPQ